jgi:hypothetical protein
MKESESIGIVIAGVGGLGEELSRDLSSESAVNELLLGSGIFSKPWLAPILPPAITTIRIKRRMIYNEVGVLK